MPDKPDSKPFQRSNVTLVDLVSRENMYKKKSFNYLWHIMNIGLFYGIPVVQLMLSYQKIVVLSGDQDYCYLNMYCANPVKNINDFNHIYSNIGYVMMGILALGVTAFRHKTIKQKRWHGIPSQYGLFYSMGIALIIEGVLSACYHICPNQSNYQFGKKSLYYELYFTI